MANPNFRFPGITLTQSFSEVLSPTSPTLGTAIVGPSYRLHRWDVAAESAKVADEYKGVLLNTTIPGASAANGETIDTALASQRLVVRNGVYSYAEKEVVFTIEYGLGKITADVNITVGKDTAPDEATFGVRGAKVGDPIIITQGSTRLVTEIVGFVVGEGGNCKTAVIASTAGLNAEAAATTAAFCYKKAYEYAAGASTFSVDPDHNSLKIQAGLTADLTADLNALGTITGTLKAGDLYLEYRERNLSYVGVRGSAADIATAAEFAGPAHPDNPLGLALYSAIMAAGGNYVFFTATRDDSPAAYVEAVDSLGKYTDAYRVVPATTDAEVIGQLVAYTKSVSENERSKIRRTLFYGIDADEELLLFEGTATVGEPESSTGKTLYPVQLRDNVFVTYPLQTGDVLEVAGKRYTIVSTNLYNTAFVEESVTISGAQLVRIIRTYPTTAQLVTNIIKKVVTSSYRACCVWADGAIMSGYDVSNYVVAAAAASMCSAEVAWRPVSCLTYSHFSVKDKAGLSYSQLEELGANGVWVVDNNDAGVPCNMMAITTAATGDVNQDNHSIISSMDSIALEICHVGENLVGSSNISDQLISMLRDEITLKLEGKTRNAPSVTIGPQLTAFVVEDVYMDNTDHVYAKLSLTPPKPFNQMAITMIAK